MAKTIRLKNDTGSTGTWHGQQIADATYYDVQDAELQEWLLDNNVFTEVSNGNLVVNNGTDTVDDFTVALDGWKWMSDNINFPVDGISKRVIVQQSSQPIVDGKDFTRVFTGVGDTIYTIINATAAVNAVKYLIKTVGTTDYTLIGSADNVVGTQFTATGPATGDGTIKQVGDIGTGPPTIIESEVGVSEKTVEINFCTSNGDVYVHEAFMMWDSAGWGDQVSAEMVHLASGTVVSRYVNKIPVFGTNHNLVLLKSSDSAFIPGGYGIRITAHNNSDTVWKLAMIAILHREITV